MLIPAEGSRRGSRRLAERARKGPVLAQFGNTKFRLLGIRVIGLGTEVHTPFPVAFPTVKFTKLLNTILQ